LNKPLRQRYCAASFFRRENGGRIMVRSGLSLDQVRTVAVPQPGGIKDLTASVLMRSLGWDDRKKIRQPSGDGAILTLIGQGADAAAMCGANVGGHGRPSCQDAALLRSTT
jgi:hypothetical protein